MADDGGEADMTATSDDQQIRALVERLMQAWTDGDARALARLVGVARRARPARPAPAEHPSG
jgi:hypothetical protein